LFPTGEPRQIGGMPDLEHEKRLGRRVCGIDEAGRGPWAGPVVAAAVIVAPELIDPGLAGIIDDSKNFSHTERLDLHAAITRAGSGFACAWAEAAVEEIDTVNILQATFLAMNRALGRLEAEIDHALVDGNIAPPLACPATPLIGGDGLSLSIAAASLVAKVERDRIMLGLRLGDQHGLRHAGACAGAGGAGADAASPAQFRSGGQGLSQDSRINS
jgi:ribonuclease HII